jgi:hypothetical protein
MQPPTGAITAYRTMELYSAKTLVTLVRRLRTSTGYFAVILPFFVVACDIDIIYTQKTLYAVNLFLLSRKLVIVGQIEGKNLPYRETIPFCLHIVP